MINLHCQLDGLQSQLKTRFCIGLGGQFQKSLTEVTSEWAVSSSRELRYNEDHGETALPVSVGWETLLLSSAAHTSSLPRWTKDKQLLGSLSEFSANLSASLHVQQFGPYCIHTNIRWVLFYTLGTFYLALFSRGPASFNKQWPRGLQRPK